MKTRKITSKLSLSKTTVATLNEKEQDHVNGGIVVPQTFYCPTRTRDEYGRINTLCFSFPPTCAHTTCV